MNSSLMGPLNSVDDLFEFIVDNSVAGIVYYSAVRNNENKIIDFRYEYINATARQNLNFLTPDLIGTLMSRHFSNEGMYWFNDFVEVVETGKSKNILLGFQVDGDTRSFRDKLVKRGDGLVLYFYDETEKLKISKELVYKNTKLHELIQKREGFYSEILNQAFDSIFYLVPIKNEDGEVIDFHNVFANESALKTIPLTREQVYHSTFLQVFPMAKETGNFQMYKECYDSGESREKLFHYEMEWIDGWFHFYCFPYAEGIMVYTRDETALRKQEQQIAKQNEELKKLLRQKDILLQETNHRVKNNLHSIASLLHIQSMNVTDEKAREAFQTSIERIKTMALIHEMLYKKNNLEQVQLEAFVSDIINSVRIIYESKKDIVYKYDIENVCLPITTCVNIGMILNELFSNSIKHGFTGRETGIISVVSKLKGQELELEVRDNGRGLPAGFSPEESPTLGVTIVSLLINQMDGKLTIRNDKGAVFSMVIPL